MTRTIVKIIGDEGRGPVETPRELLERAADLVERHPKTWARGELFRDARGRRRRWRQEAVSACALGWIMLLEARLPGTPPTEMYDRAEELLRSALPAEYRKPAGNGISSYNDSLADSGQFVEWFRDAARAKVPETG